MRAVLPSGQEIFGSQNFFSAALYFCILSFSNLAHHKKEHRKTQWIILHCAAGLPFAVTAWGAHSRQYICRLLSRARCIWFVSAASKTAGCEQGCGGCSEAQHPQPFPCCSHLYQQHSRRTDEDGWHSHSMPPSSTYGCWLDTATLKSSPKLSIQVGRPRSPLAAEVLLAWGGRVRAHHSCHSVSFLAFQRDSSIIIKFRQRVNELVIL